jgi:hypothetical protein
VLLKDFVVVLAPVISAVVVIVVAFLTPWLVRRNEHARWLREQRVEFYSGWLVLVEEGMVHIEEQKVLIESCNKLIADQEAHLKSPEPLGWRSTVLADRAAQLQGQRSELSEAGQRLRLDRVTMFNKVHLLGTAVIREEAAALDKLALKLIDAGTYRSAPEWGVGLSRFYTLARKELGVE